MISRRYFLAVAGVLPATVTVLRGQRAWEEGVWRDVKIEQSRVRLGVRAGDPNSRVPAMAAVTETRSYVIETRTARLELRQNGTIETPRIDAVVGDTVTVSVEKKRVIVRDEDGREHALILRKRTELKGQIKEEGRGKRE